MTEQTRPRVVTFHVCSVDGRLTLAPGVNLMAGDPRWTAIAGSEDPYGWIRRTYDPQVLLEGSGSFVAEDAAPRPTVDPRRPMPEHFLPPEVVDVPDRRWFTVVDGRGVVQLQFTEWPEPGWEGWHALVLACRATPAEHLAWLRERGVPYLVAGEEWVDLGAASIAMAQLLGVRTVVSTGGGRLSGALLRAGLVDEVAFDMLPAVIGGRGTPAMFDADPLRPEEQPVLLDLMDLQRGAEGRLRLRYRVRREP